MLQGVQAESVWQKARGPFRFTSWVGTVAGQGVSVRKRPVPPTGLATTEERLHSRRPKTPFHTPKSDYFAEILALHA